jgi:hypothetical protein
MVDVFTVSLLGYLFGMTYLHISRQSLNKLHQAEPNNI